MTRTVSNFPSFLDDLENTAIPLAGNLDFERKAGKLEQKKKTARSQGP